MTQSPKTIREKTKRMNQILYELIKDSSRSDHKLAKAIGISQPTVTRLRNQLEMEKQIREYTIIPDLTKMGYSIMAFFCIKYKTYLKDKVQKGSESAVTQDSSTVFASRAQGMGKNAISIALFKNYEEYSKYKTSIEVKWGDIIEDWSSMLVDLKGPILKPFSLKYLVENLTK